MINSKTIIRPAKAAPPVGPYNHAVRAGNLLFCSGQIPIDPANPTDMTYQLGFHTSLT